jgi:signal transduction histidine kinase/HAMP domain-containing protein/CheY-like chemotaxis protein
MRKMSSRQATRKTDEQVRVAEDADHSGARYTAEDLELIRDALTSLADGDYRKRWRWLDGRKSSRRGEPAADALLGEIHALVDEVGGKLTWHTAEVTQMAAQAREISTVATAVANGDLAQKITVDAQGEMLQLKDSVNTMVDQLSAFADEVTRVAREVGTEGILGGQANVRRASGVWKDLTDSVNGMASNLTIQVRNIASVATAVAKGDLSQKITVDAEGEILQLKTTINTMVDQLSAFADEVTRVAREVGTEGKLGGRAHVKGVSGTWKDLTDNVNFMANNLTVQVRNIAQVTTAVARGDLSKKITVDAQGEILQLKDTINTMVDQLSAFADEVTRMAREVGTEGQLGGQAQVRGTSGIWMELTDNVNSMAENLTEQVRNIAHVATAVAQGDLSRKITVDARGEILQLKETINTMVDQLSSFAAEVTRVAREVGSEGSLGGQAQVKGVSGTWRDLTESVNELASNLTTQVRAIAAVASAVAEGDLSQSIQVEVRGEVAELKDNVNLMVANLRETTLANKEQDWLKTNLARISGLMQGHRDLLEVARLIMTELTPLSSAQFGAFYLAEYPPDGRHAGGPTEPALRRIAAYGFRKGGTSDFAFGEGLVGQAAVERKRLLINDVPPGYIKVGSGLGEASPASVVVLPILFEDQVLGVIELASLRSFTDMHLAFFDQFVGTIGVTINTIMANSRTESLLSQSRRLTQELRERSNELQRQQGELRRSNAELEEKAAVMAKQNRAIEVQNFQIEQARRALEERAQQLALSSRYKSEFLANMSHELRTPLNSLLVLAKLLSENPDGNLSDKQVEFARTIHDAGSDLLQLINDILDLEKVEAGKMDIHPQVLRMETLVEYVEATFRPMAVDKGLTFQVDVAPDVPEQLYTDEQRLQQVLRNLLSNAVKFTSAGSVRLRISRAGDVEFTSSALNGGGDAVAFAVADTGVGIAEDKLRVIFDAFQQADGTTSRRYGGTGLGLSISRDIARLLGGEIRARSRVGHGSTFTLYLLARLPGPEEARSTGRGPDGLGAPEPVPDLAGGHALGQDFSPQGWPAEGADGPSAGTAAGAAAGTAALTGPPAGAGDRESGQPPGRAGSGPRGAERRAPGADGSPSTNGARAGIPAMRSPAAPRAEDIRLVPPEAGPGDGGDSAGTGVPGSTRHGDGPDGIQASAGPESDHSLDDVKVLIIDDDVRNVFALTSVFERCGAQVLYAENGREGIDVLERNEDVTLVLMDIMMPELDGYATTETIRRMPQFADLPIIALTAKAMKGDREKTIGAGASDYIPKPVDVDHLLQVMRKWLQREQEG